MAIRFEDGSTGTAAGNKVHKHDRVQLAVFSGVGSSIRQIPAQNTSADGHFPVGRLLFQRHSFVSYPAYMQVFTALHICVY